MRLMRLMRRRVRDGMRCGWQGRCFVRRKRQAIGLGMRKRQTAMFLWSLVKHSCKR